MREKSKDVRTTSAIRSTGITDQPTGIGLYACTCHGIEMVSDLINHGPHHCNGTDVPGFSSIDHESSGTMCKTDHQPHSRSLTNAVTRPSSPLRMRHQAPTTSNNDASVSTVSSRDDQSSRTDGSVTAVISENRRQGHCVGWVRLVIQYIKCIFFMIVLGALTVDVYLLKEATFVRTGGDAATTRTSADEIRCDGRPSTTAVAKSPHPRFPLPLVLAHHMLTRRGTPPLDPPKGSGSQATEYINDCNGHLESNLSSRPEVSSAPAQQGPSTNTRIKRTSDWVHQQERFVEQQQGHNSTSPSKQAVTFDSPPLTPDPYDGQRVAVLVPYIGSELPVWWDTFAEHARYNEGLVDWIIFCDEALVREDGPPNIIFVQMGSRRLAWMLSRILAPEEYDSADTQEDNMSEDMSGVRNKRGATVGKVKQPEVVGMSAEVGRSIRDTGIGMRTSGANRQKAALFLSKLLTSSPYSLVEFKPTLGWIFRDYIQGYTHWAFGDLDVLFGDMRRGWLEPNELRDFDIITFSFGDQHRAYLRGQLTIHKNDPKVNRIWKGCEHLRHYTDRLEDFRRNRSRRAESAEGCYSLAATSDPSLKIKFSVKALSDRDYEASPSREQEVMIDGNGLVTICPNLGYYEHLEEQSPLTQDGTITASDAEYSGHQYVQMQDPVGPVEAVKRADTSNGSCEHWIKPEFQTCMEHVGRSHTLFFVGGQYLKQEFVNTPAATGGRDCLGGAFYHFQDYKANYRTWNTRPPLYSAHTGIVVGPGGIVPVPISGWRDSSSRQALAPSVVSGKLAQYYCLEWMARKRAHHPHKGIPELVCNIKVSSSQVIGIVDTRITEMSGASSRPTMTSRETVTLGGVGAAEDLAPFLVNASDWKGPKIFAMVMDFYEEIAARDWLEANEAHDMMRDVLVVGLERNPTVVSTLQSKHDPSKLPQKALMNLISDLCETRYLFTLPGPARLSENAFQVITHHLSSMTTPPSRPTTVTGASPSHNSPGPVTLVVPFDIPPSPSSPLSSHPPSRGDSTAAASAAAAAEATTTKGSAAANRTTKGARTAAATMTGLDSPVSIAGNSTFKVAEATIMAPDAEKAAAEGARAAVAAAEAAEKSANSTMEAAARAGTTVETLTQAMVQATAMPLTNANARIPSIAEKAETTEEVAFRKLPETSLLTSHRKPPTVTSRTMLRGVVHKNVEERRDAMDTSSLPLPVADTPPPLKAAAERRRLLGSESPTTSASNWIDETNEADEMVEWDEEEDEEDWVRSLLWSGAEMPGLVVDMWSPGALFLRHVEEFGGAGCLDGAYALGLWHAGSSFRVATGVAMTPTSTSIHSQEALSSEADSRDPEPELADTCLPGQAVVTTAAIYSMFLRQVANVYRHPQSGKLDRQRWEHTSSSTSKASSNEEHRWGMGIRATSDRIGGNESVPPDRATGARPAIAREPFAFSWNEYPRSLDGVLPGIGGLRTPKGGWGGV